MESAENLLMEWVNSVHPRYHIHVVLSILVLSPTSFVPLLLPHIDNLVALEHTKETKDDKNILSWSPVKPNEPGCQSRMIIDNGRQPSGTEKKLLRGEGFHL